MDSMADVAARELLGAEGVTLAPNFGVAQAQRGVCAEP